VNVTAANSAAMTAEITCFIGFSFWMSAGLPAL
jgi:hypothetical protein